MSDHRARHDRWSSGEAYERYVGRWSRLVAGEFVPWLAVPQGSAWLDVGCGTGALTEAVLAEAAPARVEGVDAAAAFVATAQERVANARAGFGVADALALPFSGARFDAVVSGLVLNFVPDPARMVAESRRVAREGGAVAAYIWDYAGEMQFMRHFWDAAAALNPRAGELDEGRRFPVARPSALSGLFADAGLTDVCVRAIDVPTCFISFADFWEPFLGGQGAAGGYCASLADEQRASLRQRLRASLPIEPDGSIRLLARAWAVKGKVT